MIKPATTEMPNGRRISEPSPEASASGSPPRIAAQLVIMIGRNRTRQAWKIASSETEDQIHTFSLCGLCDLSVL
jgi:hypothetical protein